MMKKSEMNKLFKNMLDVYNKRSYYYDMEIKSKYVIDMFENEIYVEVVLLQDGDELQYEVIDINSRAKAYNTAKAIEAYFLEKGIEATYEKHVYN